MHAVTRKISRYSVIVSERTAPFAFCNGLITSCFLIQASAYHSMHSRLSGNFVRRSSLPAAGGLSGSCRDSVIANESVFSVFEKAELV